MIPEAIQVEGYVENRRWDGSLTRDAPPVENQVFHACGLPCTFLHQYKWIFPPTVE